MKTWWTVPESNRRSPQCECGALPTELTAQKPTDAEIITFTDMYNNLMEYLLILTFWFVAALVLSLTQKIHLYRTRRERLEIVVFSS